MSRIFVVNIVSLDGYYEGPDGHPMDLPMDAAFDAYNRESIERASAVLLGATSYRMFGSYWPGIADAPDDPGNRQFSEDNRAFSRTYNELTKVLVSDSFEPPADHPWYETTTVVKRDDVAAWVDQQKQTGGDVVVYGSRTTWNGLLAHGLVDEVHLMTGNVVLGGGTPAFSTPVAGLRLLDVRRFDGSDNVLLVYGT